MHCEQQKFGTTEVSVSSVWSDFSEFLQLAITSTYKEITFENYSGIQLLDPHCLEYV